MGRPVGPPQPHAAVSIFSQFQTRRPGLWGLNTQLDSPSLCAKEHLPPMLAAPWRLPVAGVWPCGASSRLFGLTRAGSMPFAPRFVDDIFDACPLFAPFLPPFCPSWLGRILWAAFVGMPVLPLQNWNSWLRARL